MRRRRFELATVEVPGRIVNGFGAGGLVARYKYSGTLGRTANCQVAVSLHLAGELGSSSIGMRLYLP
jgi:hypothetical protein